MTQVAPPAPHEARDRVAQMVSWQQPLGQDTPSQVHLPDTQRWPPAQAGPVPQAQVPVVAQASARVGSQAAQADPPTPQLSSERLVQMFPRQQPAGQDAPSQRQTLFMQRCPAPHGGPPPQRQSPPREQVSALLESQVPQAMPPTPQVCAERG